MAWRAYADGRKKYILPWGMHLVNDLLPLFLVGSMPLPAGRQATLNHLFLEIF